MESLKYLFDSFMLIFTHQFTIWGFTISFFEIAIFSTIAGIIGKLLYGLFD